MIFKHLEQKKTHLFLDAFRILLLLIDFYIADKLYLLLSAIYCIKLWLAATLANSTLSSLILLPGSS